MAQQKDGKAGRHDVCIRVECSEEANDGQNGVGIGPSLVVDATARVVMAFVAPEFENAKRTPGFENFLCHLCQPA